MIQSNCFIVNDNIYIITGCEKGKSLDKYGRSKYYYTIVNTRTKKRKKLTEKLFKETFIKYKIKWQKSQTDLKKIKI